MKASLSFMLSGWKYPNPTHVIPSSYPSYLGLAKKGMKAKLSLSFMLSGWKIPQPHSRHPIQVSLLPGPGREMVEGIAVLVLHVVRVENTPTHSPYSIQLSLT